MTFIAACANAEQLNAPSAALDDLAWAIDIGELTEIHRDIVYRTANNYDIKLDIYTAKDSKNPKPTLLFMHGGAWLGDATKDTSHLFFLPFLRLGWTVINIDYRPSNVSLAPAAVEDCLCALRWVVKHSTEYRVDTRQIVTMGISAGGLLALTTGMIPSGSSSLGDSCDVSGDRAEKIKVAAIVNWIGITDVVDLVEGPNQRGFALMWLGNQPNRVAIAKQVSPMSYVNAGVPPIITIHGDKDGAIPYGQVVRFHDALTKAQVTNKLVTIPGGEHWGFGSRSMRDAFTQVVNFLGQFGLPVNVD